MDVENIYIQETLQAVQKPLLSVWYIISQIEPSNSRQ